MPTRSFRHAARTVGAAAFVFGALVAQPGPALANGRFPAANQLVIFPRAPENLVLRATFGILFSHDAGKTWDWVCERAVGYGGIEDPALGVVGARTVLAGTFEGLGVSQDLGCSWRFVEGEPKSDVFIDVTARSVDPRSALALTSTYLGDDAGASLYASRLFATADEGATWHRHGVALPAYALAETVDGAPSDPARLYASAARADRSAGLFYASRDDGQTFTETLIQLAPSERAPFIAAVDPVNADRVYVRTGGGPRSRLLVTDDGGRTFREVFAGAPLLGFALSADGSRIWVGNSDGLYTATRPDLAFTKRSNVSIQCLAHAGGILYACSAESSGFIVGASRDDGATFEPLLHLSTVRAPLDCPANTSAAVCSLEWPALREQLGIPDDAGADGGRGAASSNDEGGCSVSFGSFGSFGSLGPLGSRTLGGGIPAGAASLFTLAAAAVARRARRASRQRAERKSS
ncbi:WD40/YVTN/BNR-like repeat-containing protein [Pendulispora albinea]|uniref:Uncharacterized protein n=1 Tax=Pendulispora albinea TaxID=2741071 RepID=A0ABZ2M0V0_9BACT